MNALKKILGVFPIVFLVSLLFIKVAEANGLKQELNKLLKRALPVLLVQKHSHYHEVINDTMEKNDFAEEVEVDGYERVTIYTECVQGGSQVKDLPLHIWSSASVDDPRFYGLVDGDLDCGRPKTIDVQGALYKFQYLGDDPSIVRIQVYLVP